MVDCIQRSVPLVTRKIRVALDINLPDIVAFTLLVK